MGLTATAYSAHVSYWPGKNHFFISGDLTLDTGYLVDHFSLLIIPSTECWDSTIE
jgi:hypothetical protein